MQPPYCKDIRENPTPAEWVAAWHENEETALCKSRKAGHATGSPGDPQQANGSAPETQSC